MSVDDTAKIRAAIAEGGPTAATDLIRDSWVDQFAIVGTLSECRQELKALMAAHNLDEFQVSVTDLATAAEDLDLAASLVNDR